MQSFLNDNSFNFAKRDLIVSSIVKPGGTWTFVVGHLLGHFKPTTVAQVFRDASRPEGVAADLRSHVSGLGPPSDHPVDVRLAHGPV